jgi:hypothetical protein
LDEKRRFAWKRQFVEGYWWAMSQENVQYADDTLQRREDRMVLATAKIEDFDRFWNAFSTKGAEKRKQHGSKGSHVFRDPNDDRRVWVIFDLDEEGYRNLMSDPDMPAIFEEGGLQGRPQAAELARTHDT